MESVFFQFFGLRENPFSVNPDPRFLVLSRQTQEALQELSYGVQTRKGFILLTGEVGTGKTILINQLLDWLRQLRTPTAFVFNSQLDKGQLFDFILADFGIRPDPRHTGNPLMCLNQWLIDRYSAGESPVLIVDEAQGLTSDVLEEIRLLLNLETPREKLLQIVLAGQPELEDKLARPELRQLRQRIMLRCRIFPLTRDETRAYIEQRLRIGGANSRAVFEPEAMDAVYFYARGIPRVINLVCERALINAYVDQVQPVPAHLVEAVAGEFQLDEVRPFHLTVTSASTPVTPNQATIQSILDRAQMHQPSAHEPEMRAAAHASAARASAFIPEVRPVSSNQPPPPILQGPAEIPSISRPQAAASATAPVQPAAVFPPTKQRRFWPLHLPGRAPAAGAQYAARGVSTRAPVGPSPVVRATDADTRADAVSVTAHNQVSGLDAAALRLPEIHNSTGVSGGGGSQPNPWFREWLNTRWPRWRDKCLEVVSPAAWSPRTASLRRRLQESFHRVQRHWRASGTTSPHQSTGAPVRPAHPRQSFFWRSSARRDTYLPMTPAPRQRIMGSFVRWLQQPLASAQRRLPDQTVYNARGGLGHKQV